MVCQAALWMVVALAAGGAAQPRRPAAAKTPQVGAKPAAAAPKPVAFPYDGLWTGETSAGDELWMLVKGGKVVWIETPVDLPRECRFGGGNMGGARRPVRKMKIGAPGQIRDAAFAAEIADSWEPFLNEAAKLNGRFATPAEMAGEFSSTPSSPSGAVRGCTGPIAFTWRAHRATRDEVMASRLTLAERIEAGERDPQPSPTDGVWIGKTSGDKDIQFLIQENTLVWLKTGHEVPMPPACGFMGTAEQEKVGFSVEDPAEARVKGGAFKAVYRGNRPFKLVDYVMTGKKTPEGMAGDLELTANEPAKGCDVRMAWTWTAHRGSLEEAKPHLSLPERIQAGESIPVLKGVSMGRVPGGDCQKGPFEPGTKPYVYPAGVREVAYRIQFNPEGASFLRSSRASIKGPIGGGTTTTSCTTYAIIMGNPAPSATTTIVRRTDKAPFPAGAYKLEVYLGEAGAPSATVSFTVK
jgi:hypothetical protein